MFCNGDTVRTQNASFYFLQYNFNITAVINVLYSQELLAANNGASCILHAIFPKISHQGYSFGQFVANNMIG